MSFLSDSKNFLASLKVPIRNDDDLVQIVAIAMWRASLDYNDNHKSKASLKTLKYKYGLNALRQEIQRRRRKKNYLISIEEPSEIESTYNFEKTKLYDLLYQSIGELDENEKEYIQMILCGADYQDIVKYIKRDEIYSLRAQLQSYRIFRQKIYDKLKEKISCKFAEVI